LRAWPGLLMADAVANDPQRRFFLDLTILVSPTDH
jgi:hypothetical protein